MDLHILLNIFVLFGVTVAVIIICNFLKIPHLIGYLFTGILLSPNTTSLLKEAHEVEIYAEIGVILLLYTVGLEFSFSNLRKIQRYILIGGSLQVFLTILFTTLLIWAMGRSIEESIFWGFVTALSSTAIVIKTLQDKVKLNTSYGKVILAVLLFQDIMIVPLMLFTPILAGQEGNPLIEIGELLLKLGGIGVLSWFLSRWVIPKLLYQIMKIQSQEVFLLTSIFIVTGITLLTSYLELSLALGAFIAGLIIAETDYNRLAISCFLPFRYVFISFFFISMGMLLDYRIFIQEFPLILFWLGFILLVKIAAGTSATFALKLPFKTSFTVGLALAQIGEFSFLLSKEGLDQGLISETSYQIFLSVSILTMAFTPFILNILEKTPPFVLFLRKKLWKKTKTT
ncbi:MAG: cation:proton antiporter [Thermonemataceae bacterium]